VNHLLNQKLIRVEPQKNKGKKTYVRTIKGDKTKEFMIKALEVLESRKEMTPLEFIFYYLFLLNPSVHKLYRNIKLGYKFFHKFT